MQQLQDILNILAPDIARTNDIIHDALFTPNQLLNRVVSTYLKTKGKQIRPVLVLLSANFFGKVNYDTLLAAAALELLHNASLIHDDVVDETDLRRGVPTINIVEGNHLAVLVGDYFVSNALSVSIRTGNIAVISAISDLGKELSLGEIDQVCNVRDHLFDEQSYLDMISKKTASLFLNCVKLGAETVNATPETYSHLLKYAELLGLCFQIRDDIFDYFNDDKIGKPTGNDLREGKVTLPLLYALNSAPKAEADEMKKLLIRGNLSRDEISTLVDFAINNGGIDYAYEKMREFQRRAQAYLAPYPDSEAKQCFADLFDFIITRTK